MVEEPRIDSARAGVLLRAHPGALGRRRRDQQRRRRAALGRRGARARPRRARRGGAAGAGRRGPARQRRPDHAALPALRARAALERASRAAPTSACTRQHRRGHLVRAAVEGVCQQLALVLASMRDAGNEVREIRATGGFARSAAVAPDAGRRAGHADRVPGRARGLGASAPRCSGWRRSAIDRLDRAWPQSSCRSRSARPRPPPRPRSTPTLRPVFASLYDALLPAFRALQRHR